MRPPAGKEQPAMRFARTRKSPSSRRRRGETVSSPAVRLLFLLSLTLLALSTTETALGSSDKLRIDRVEVDAAASQMKIIGVNFGGAEPAVSLGGSPLHIVSYNPTEILVNLPGGITPGTYLLTVSAGSGAPTQDSFNVAVGAQGPKGDKGDPGAPGSGVGSINDLEGLSCARNGQQGRTALIYADNGDALLRCIQGALPPGSLPSLSVTDAAEQEGFSAEFTVTLSAPGYHEVSVDFATADGTATASTNDYLPAAGRLTFAPGETTKTIAVGLSFDGVAEPDETFAFNLGNASNATIADARGVGTIRDFVPRVVTRIEIEPALQVTVGGSVQFDARAFDQYGNQMFPHIIWQSSDGNVGYVNPYNNSASYIGVATGVNVGTTQVTATSDGVTSNTATLTVYTPLLSRIELSASGSTHAVGAP